MIGAYARRVNRSWLLLAGLLILALLIWHYNPRRVLNSLGPVDFRWLVFSGLLITASVVLGAVNVYLLMGHSGRPGFLTFLPIYWLSWAIGLIFPGQIGDLATLSLLLQRHGMVVSFTLGRALLDKVVSLIIMVVVGTAGALSLLSPGSLDFRGYALLLLLIVAVFVLLITGSRYVFRRDDVGQNPGLVEVLVRSAQECCLAARQMPERVIANSIVTLVKVGFTGLAYWAMFVALGVTHLSAWQIASLSILAGLVAYVPVSFNGYGTVEAVGITLFGHLAVQGATVLAVYLCLRLCVLALAWLPIALFLPCWRAKPNSL